MSQAVLTRTPLGERALTHAAKSLPQDIAVVIAMVGHGVERATLIAVGSVYTTSFEKSVDKAIRLGLIATPLPAPADHAANEQLPTEQVLSARFGPLLELALRSAHKPASTVDGPTKQPQQQDVMPSELTKTVFLRKQIEQEIDFESFGGQSSPPTAQPSVAQTPGQPHRPIDLQAARPSVAQATFTSAQIVPPSLASAQPLDAMPAPVVPATATVEPDLAALSTTASAPQEPTVLLMRPDTLPAAQEALAEQQDDQPLTAAQLDALDALDHQEQEMKKTAGISQPLSYIPANPMAPIFATEPEAALAPVPVSALDAPATTQTPTPTEPLPAISLSQPTPEKAAQPSTAKSFVRPPDAMPNATDRRNAQALALELRATQRLGAMVTATQGRQQELQTRLVVVKAELEQLQHGLAEAQYEKSNAARGLDDAIAAVATIREETRDRQSEILSAQTQLDASKRSLLALKNENAYLELQRERLLKDQETLSEQVRVVRERIESLQSEHAQLIEEGKELSAAMAPVVEPGSFRFGTNPEPGARAKAWAGFSLVVLGICLGLGWLFLNQYNQATNNTVTAGQKLPPTAANKPAQRLSPMQTLLISEPHPYDTGVGAVDRKLDEGYLQLRVSDQLKDSANGQ